MKLADSFALMAFKCAVCAVVSLARSFHSTHKTLSIVLCAFLVYSTPSLCVEWASEEHESPLFRSVEKSLFPQSRVNRPVIACVNLETTFFARVRNGDRGFEVEEA